MREGKKTECPQLYTQKAGRQSDRQADWQTVRQTECQADRQANIKKAINSPREKQHEWNNV